VNKKSPGNLGFTGIAVIVPLSSGASSRLPRARGRRWAGAPMAYAQTNGG
jgi:hypothetical protein